MIPFTQSELDQLYTALKTSVSQVKNLDTKTTTEIDGCVYTNMRRELYGNSCLFPLFSKQRKRQGPYSDDKYKFYLQLLERIKMSHLSKDDNAEAIKDLRLSLSEMRDAQSKMDKANKDSDRVAEQLLGIKKTLNPHGDENEREAE